MLKTSKILHVMVLMLPAFILAGCTKAPDSVHSPSIKVDYVIEDNTEKYTVHFTGGIRNENNSTVLQDVTGEIVVYRSAEKQMEALRLPFSLANILPMSTGIIEMAVDKKDTEVDGLLELLNVDREKLQADGSASGLFIGQEKVSVDKLKFTSCNITDLLEEKLNEKL
jgi:hypothetical protein